MSYLVQPQNYKLFMAKVWDAPEYNKAGFIEFNSENAIDQNCHLGNLGRNLLSVHILHVEKIWVQCSECFKVKIFGKIIEYIDAVWFTFLQNKLK